MSAILFILVQFATDKNIGLIEILNQKDRHNSFSNKYLSPLLSGLFLFCTQIFLIQFIKLSPNPAYPKAILASQILITTLVSQFMFKTKIATTKYWYANSFRSCFRDDFCKMISKYAYKYNPGLIKYVSLLLILTICYLIYRWLSKRSVGVKQFSSKKFIKDLPNIVV